MNKGKSKMLPFIIFAVGVLVIGFGLICWNRAEDGSDDKTNQLAQEIKGDSTKALRRCDDVDKSLVDIRTWISDNTAVLGGLKDQLEAMRKDNDILKTRQYTMEKKILASSRTLNLNLSSQQPLEVSVVPPKKRSLLNKAGVK